MENGPAEFLFLAAGGDGLPGGLSDKRTVRSHVQRAILRHRKNRPSLEKMKVIRAESNSHNIIKGKNKGTERPSNMQYCATVSFSAQRPTHVLTTDREVSGALSANRDTRTIPDTLPTVDGCLANHHPWALLAAEFVHMPSSRLDELFKSVDFRTAAEPLFDSSHVDAKLNMFAVFPDCGSEPAFLNALVFCILQVSHRGQATREALLVKARTIKILNERIVSAEGCLSAPVIGAIMMLRCIAYKFHDCESHEVHARGLHKILEMCHQTSLTTAAKRALFWSDLFAMMLVDGKRRLAYPALPQQIRWQRGNDPRGQKQLPAGFVRHSADIPADLLDCVCEIVELQKLLGLEQLAHTPRHDKYCQLDFMQASIESRLASGSQSCKKSPFAEALRLAIFLCSYCSWMETWNSYLIPCRIGEQLLELLTSTMLTRDYWHGAFWSGKTDVLLWLLLVTCMAVELDGGHDVNLKIKEAQLLSHARYALSNCLFDELNHALACARQDFLYCDQWLLWPRRSVPWFELEMLIQSEALGLKV